MTYVVDANAMIAVLNDEPGAHIVEMLLTARGTIAYAHAVNMCEVFYWALRSGSEDTAQEALADIRSLGIQTRADMDDEFWQDVGRMKVSHKMSLADAFAVTLANKIDCDLITSDHHELDAVAAAGACRINFFR